jgi:hypothetical protein
MEVFGMAAFFGWILGFMFGVGCAAAVIYTVYMGGYRKGMEDSLRSEKSVRYRENIEKVQAALDKELSQGAVKTKSIL